MSIDQILGNLDSYPEESLILVVASAPILPESEAKVVPIPTNSVTEFEVSGFRYFIEVYHAKDVLETWSSWRNGRIPSIQESIDAIQYFQANDSYLPVQGDE